MSGEMLSVEERVTRYRVRAEEALEFANRATDHRARSQLLLVAQGWKNLADITERSLLDRYAIK
jgi:hypothetical protein